MTSRTLRLLAAATVPVLAAGALTGCSSSDKKTSATPTPTTSVSESPSESSGPELTEAGSQLAFGDTATVDHTAKGATGTLGLTVKSATQGVLKDFTGFNLDDPYRKKANYFYVRVSVTNAGTAAYGGFDVPLYGISGDNTLLPIVKFTSAFKKCDTQPVPKDLAPGKSFATCLVFLSPNKGSLEGVSYRPTEDFVPIEWHGTVVVPKADKKKRTKKG